MTGTVFCSCPQNCNSCKNCKKVLLSDFCEGKMHCILNKQQVKLKQIRGDAVTWNCRISKADSSL